MMWADWDEIRQLHTVYVCWVPGYRADMGNVAMGRWLAA